MDLERVSAELRTRRPFEAIDLGVRLLRAELRAVLPLWCVVVVPSFALVLALFGPMAGSLVFWWLRPLFDRVPLFVLSQALFGARPRLREGVAALPRLLAHELFAALVLRRFDPRRAFHLPMHELEGLTGAERSRRAALLDRDARGALPLIFVNAMIEITLGLVLVSLWLAFTGDAEDSWLWLADGTRAEAFTQSWAGAVVFALAFLIAEPLYVAGGFGLYLNRRVQLEGWDIEIWFKRLARRVMRAPSRVAALVLALVCLASPGVAQERALAQAPPEQVIAEVLKSKEFGETRKETRKRWRRGGGPESACAIPAAGSALGIALLGVALVLTVVILLRAFGGPRGASARGPRAEGPKELFGLDLRAESLPQDVAGEAWRLFANGEPRAALALLYRAALVAALARGRAIKKHHTEGDCLELVVAADPPELAREFNALTRAWQACAYAHRAPDAVTVRALCDAHAGSRA